MFNWFKKKKKYGIYECQVPALAVANSKVVKDMIDVSVKVEILEECDLWGSKVYNVVAVEVIKTSLETADGVKANILKAVPKVLAIEKVRAI